MVDALVAPQRAARPMRPDSAAEMVSTSHERYTRRNSRGSATVSRPFAKPAMLPAYVSRRYVAGASTASSPSLQVPTQPALDSVEVPLFHGGDAEMSEHAEFSERSNVAGTGV